jgi:hypothetical protein
LSLASAGPASSVRPPGVLTLGTRGDLPRQTTVDQVLDRHRLEDLTKTGTGGDPHVLQDHGGVVVAHGLRAQSVHAHQWSVDRTDHVGHADVTGVTGKPPAAGLTALAHDEAGATQVSEYRLQEPVRYVLQPAELLGRDGHRLDSGCDFDQSTQRVVRLRGNPHAVSLSERRTSLLLEAGWCLLRCSAVSGSARLQAEDLSSFTQLWVTLVDNQGVTRFAYALASLLLVLLPSATSATSSDATSDTSSTHRALGNTVAVIGDSLTDQRGAGQARIEDALRSRGHGSDGIYFWGEGGKELSAPDSRGMTTPQNIRAARALLGHVDTFVIALGTTERFSSRTEIRHGMSRVVYALGADDFVWIGTGFHDGDSANSRKVNRILEAKIAASPHGRYADWNDFIHAPVRDSRDLWIFPRDRLHMTEKGYLIRARYYARSIG